MRDAGVEGALALAGVFVGHEHGSAPFAAEPEALTEAQGLEDDRRGDADALIGGHKADADGGEAHDEHGQDEHALAAQLVPEMAEDEAAEGPRQIADGKGAVGQNGADEGVSGREEELVENNARHDAVEEKVIPFDGGSEQTGEDDLADFLLAWCAHAMLLGDDDAVVRLAPPPPMGETSGVFSGERHLHG